MEISDLQIGDIGFSFKKRNILSKIIYRISIFNMILKKKPKRISHTFIYIGHGLIAESTFTGTIIVNIDKYLDSDKYELEFQTPIYPFTVGEKQIIFNMAAKEAGLIKYSFGQLFVILFNKWFKIRAYDFSQKQMHCSEFISSIYERLNRKLTSQDSHMNSPIDIYESALLKDI